MSSPSNSRLTQAAALRRIASLRGINAMSKKSPAAAKFFSAASKFNPKQRAGLQAYYNSTHAAGSPANPGWQDAHKLGPLGTNPPKPRPFGVTPGAIPTSTGVGTKLGTPRFPAQTTQPVPSPIKSGGITPAAIKRRLKVS